MRAPDYLLKEGVNSLPCIGDGRQSGTSGSPSILNASPEAAAGGGLAILQTGDRVRIDVGRGKADILISGEELAKRYETLSAEAASNTRSPDAMAGNPARHRQPNGNRRGSGTGREVSAHCANQGSAARQPLRQGRLRLFDGKGFALSIVMPGLCPEHLQIFDCSRFCKSSGQARG